MKILLTFTLIIISIISLIGWANQSAKSQTSPYAQWQNGPSRTAEFFPIAVWLQNPRNASKYQAIGINTYIGLWKGPTEKQLAALKQAGMKVICAQNEAGLKHRHDPTIIAWMHGDEPDNAQSRGKGKGYGPPILPSKIEADYQKIKQNDPSRPVVFNSPTVENQVTVVSSNPNVPIAALTKKYRNDTYLFTVDMRNGSAKATFKMKNQQNDDKTITVLDEDRTLTCRHGVFQDAFQPWDVHLCKITDR